MAASTVTETTIVPGREIQRLRDDANAKKDSLRQAKKEMQARVAEANAAMQSTIDEQFGVPSPTEITNNRKAIWQNLNNESSELQRFIGACNDGKNEILNIYRQCDELVRQHVNEESSRLMDSLGVRESDAVTRVTHSQEHSKLCSWRESIREYAMKAVSDLVADAEKRVTEIQSEQHRLSKQWRS